MQNVVIYRRETEQEAVREKTIWSLQKVALKCDCSKVLLSNNKYHSLEPIPSLILLDY